MDWIKYSTDSRQKFNNIFFIDNNTGWLVGQRYTDTTSILKSTNGGVNWFRLKNSFTNPLSSIFFIDALTGWAGGANGLILKTFTGGLTSAVTYSEIIPNNYMLLQNYPNPFNPETTIRYLIPEKGYVKITLYDASGKVLEEIVNEVQNAGEYKISFDGGDYPSGVYFYKLNSGGFTQTRKMLLIK